MNVSFFYLCCMALYNSILIFSILVLWYDEVDVWCHLLCFLYCIHYHVICMYSCTLGGQQYSQHVHPCLLLTVNILSYSLSPSPKVLVIVRPGTTTVHLDAVFPHLMCQTCTMSTGEAFTSLIAGVRVLNAVQGTSYIKVLIRCSGRHC